MLSWKRTAATRQRGRGLRRSLRAADPAGAVLGTARRHPGAGNHPSAAGRWRLANHRPIRSVTRSTHREAPAAGTLRRGMTCGSINKGWEGASVSNRGALTPGDAHFVFTMKIGDFHPHVWPSQGHEYFPRRRGRESRPLSAHAWSTLLTKRLSVDSCLRRKNEGVAGKAVRLTPRA